MAVEGYKSKNVDESLGSWDKILAALPKDMQDEFNAMNRDGQEILKMTIMSDMKRINNMSIEEVENELWKQTLSTMDPEEQQEYNEMDEDEQDYHKYKFLDSLKQDMESGNQE